MQNEDKDLFSEKLNIIEFTLKKKNNICQYISPYICIFLLYY